MLNILNIQDNNVPDVLTLDEAFKSCIESNSTSLIYGAYAFVTTGGFDIMFNNIEQKEYIKKVTLIIGMDGITNTECVEYLKKTDPRIFDIKAYIPNTSSAIFHPKFCILANDSKSKGWLIIGSGNLTVRGIRKNQEAYTAIELSESDLNEVLKTWENWLNATNKNIKNLNDEVVTARALRNSHTFRRPSTKGVRSSGSKTGRKDPSTQTPAGDTFSSERKDLDGWLFNNESEVLIAEIPKASTRWNQANFDKKTYLEYFAGSLVTSKKQVILRHVSPVNGVLESIEYRPCVAVKSQNYRVELSAASGLDYPKSAAPIAVFINVGKRTFIYSLFMPEHAYYHVLRKWVDYNWKKSGGRSDRKCRLTFPFHEHRKLLQPTELYKYFEDENSNPINIESS